MSELFVLHIRSYYPYDYYFEEMQYLNNIENICSGRNLYQDNNIGRNLSTIIYYDIYVDKFVLLTDNITFTLNGDKTTYNTTHKYNRFVLENDIYISILLSRMAFDNNIYELLQGFHGKYNLHKLVVDETISYENMLYNQFIEFLTETNKIIYFDCFRFNKVAIREELELIKHLTMSNHLLKN